MALHRAVQPAYLYLTGPEPKLKMFVQSSQSEMAANCRPSNVGREHTYNLKLLITVAEAGTSVMRQA